MTERVDAFLEKTEFFIKAIKNGEKISCEGCPELREGYWDNENKINVLAISPSFPCQLSCTYCSVPSNARLCKENKEIQELAKKIDVIDIVKHFEERGLLNLTEPIQISSGEITIHPKKHEILGYLSKYPLQIFSNCVIYDEQVAKLIAREGSFLNVSLDAGTADTYYKVKGLNAFNKVKETIKKYKKNGGNIEIKYILLEENCDMEDLEGFISFCKDIDIRMINISCDISINHDNLPMRIVDAAIYLANKAKEIGILYRVLPYFGTKNMEYINSKI